MYSLQDFDLVSGSAAARLAISGASSDHAVGVPWVPRGVGAPGTTCVLATAWALGPSFGCVVGASALGICGMLPLSDGRRGGGSVGRVTANEKLARPCDFPQAAMASWYSRADA